MRSTESPSNSKMTQSQFNLAELGQCDRCTRSNQADIEGFHSRPFHTRRFRLNNEDIDLFPSLCTFRGPLVHQTAQNVFDCRQVFHSVNALYAL